MMTAINVLIGRWSICTPTSQWTKVIIFYKLFYYIFRSTKRLINSEMFNFQLTFHSSLTIQSHARLNKYIDQSDNSSWHVLGFDLVGSFRWFKIWKNFLTSLEKETIFDKILWWKKIKIRYTFKWRGEEVASDIHLKYRFHRHPFKSCQKTKSHMIDSKRMVLR